MILELALLLALIMAGCGSGMGGDGGAAGGGTPAYVFSCGSEFYVSPTGTSAGDGSEAGPWDLQTALNHPAAVQPGDCIWLKGGVYAGMFTSFLNGTSGHPIIVRALPGERATLDVNADASSIHALTVNRSYVWFWGLEIMSSNLLRQSSLAGSSPSDLKIKAGITLGNSTSYPSQGVRFINLIVHDTHGSYGFWMQNKDSEIYGNLIYNNGWDGPDRGHGHGIYAQNKEGWKWIGDNILFNNFGNGVQIYGSDAAQLKGFHLEGNTSFGAGSLNTHELVNTYTIGGGTPAERIRFIKNHGYQTTFQCSGANLGWGFPNKDIVITDNYLVCGTDVTGWATATVTGNTFVGKSTMMRLTLDETQSTGNYAWERNAYFQLPDQWDPFNYFKGPLNAGWAFPEWKENTGLDQNSSFTTLSTTPGGIKSFVRPNKYEPGRAHITIYNWDHASTVQVNLSNVKNADGSPLLKTGDAYELHNVQDYFNDVITGTYGGGNISVTMTGHTVATPVNWTAAPSTFPQFGAFVLMKR